MGTEEAMSGGMFYLLVGMFLLGCTTIALVLRWYARWRNGVDGTKMNMEEARDEFGRLMSERLAIAMRGAELDKLIIDRWEEWPLEYRPALYQVLRHTQLLEETMFEEAVDRGIYTRRMLEGPLLPPQPPVMTRTKENAVTASPTFSTVEATPPKSNVHPIRGLEWIGGQLMRVASE